MKPRLLLTLIACVTCAVWLPAQEPLPASTQERLATSERLDTLTQKDIANISSKAKSGDEEAQYWLALINSEGRLIPKNQDAAREWMLKSAEQGYAPAQEGMAGIYLSAEGIHPRDNTEAERWFRLAAAQGYAEAQFWLGTGYEQGWFGAKDYGEALGWLRKAAQQGLPDAQFCLGQMYEDGEGVPANDVIAAHWYRKAADHVPSYLGGVFDGAVQLVYMYRDGRLPKDEVEAYMWFAIVGSWSDPPSDEDVKEISRRMTQAEIVEAQRRAEDWIKRHTSQPETVAKEVP